MGADGIRAKYQKDANDYVRQKWRNLVILAK